MNLSQFWWWWYDGTAPGFPLASHCVFLWLVLSLGSISVLLGVLCCCIANQRCENELLSKQFCICELKSDGKFHNMAVSVSRMYHLSIEEYMNSCIHVYRSQFRSVSIWLDQTFNTYPCFACKVSLVVLGSAWNLLWNFYSETKLSMWHVPFEMQLIVSDFSCRCEQNWSCPRSYKWY